MKEYIELKKKLGLTDDLLSLHLGKCSLSRWKEIEEERNIYAHFKALRGLEFFYHKLYEDLESKIFQEGLTEMLFADSIQVFAKETKLPPILFYVSKAVYKKLSEDNPKFTYKGYQDFTEPQELMS